MSAKTGYQLWKIYITTNAPPQKKYNYNNMK